MIGLGSDCNICQFPHSITESNLSPTGQKRECGIPYFLVWSLCPQNVTMGFNERRIMKNLYVFLLLLLAFPLLASAQSLELSGGYAHISGDGGLDGFNVGAAAWVTHRVSLAFDYDSAWDTSHLGAFELTQTGVIVTKSHLQDFLVGPRISFPGVLKTRRHTFRACGPSRKYSSALRI